MCLLKPLEFLLNMFLNQFQMVIIYCHAHILTIYMFITWTCQMINKIQQVTSSNHKLPFFWPFLAPKLTVAKSHHRLQRGPAVMELAPEAPEALRRPDFPRRLRRVRR